MPGPRYVRLAALLPAYGGAVAQALARTAAAAEPVPDRLRPPQAPPGVVVEAPTPISPAVAALSPHADLFSFATSGGDGG